MSLSRAVRLARPRPAATFVLNSRLSSSDSHIHEHEHHDTTQYPVEGFRSSFWTGSVLFSLLVVAFYKFAPAPGEDVFLTRYLAKFGTPREVLNKINFQHLLLTQQVSADTLLISDARRPLTHRYRYPQSFDQASPHMQVVGGTVDLNGLNIKGDRD